MGIQKLARSVLTGLTALAITLSSLGAAPLQAEDLETIRTGGISAGPWDRDSNYHDGHEFGWGEVWLASIIGAGSGIAGSYFITESRIDSKLDPVKKDVATNATNIATNTTDIATNAADIATNATDIATNTAAIATNASDISDLQALTATTTTTALSVTIANAMTSADRDVQATIQSPNGVTFTTADIAETGNTVVNMLTQFGVSGVYSVYIEYTGTGGIADGANVTVTIPTHSAISQQLLTFTFSGGEVPGDTLPAQTFIYQ